MAQRGAGEGRYSADERARARALAVVGRAAAWPEWRFRLGLWRLGPVLAGALVAELDERRGFLWLPVAFGLGVALYFGADHEPSLAAALLLALALTAFAFAARGRPAAFFALAGAAAVAAGFAIATVQVARIQHPVLAERLVAVPVSGFVERAERRERGGRVVLKVTALGRLDAAERPLRVRLALASGVPPPVGAHVSGLATLAPPPGPAFPGGYDFGRDAWFDGIGATGFTLGRLRESPSALPPPAGLGLAVRMEALRQAIAARIRAALADPAAGVAVALVAGARDAVPQWVEESMRVSGLSHVLSISGLHMALVAAGLFALARGLLALSPNLATHRPIKAWAAVPAALGATFYLLLSGAEVPTQRSYAMTLLVLAGVIAGRPAFTLRTLAVAALAVLMLSPHALLEPGPQMSFAATLALIAAYESSWLRRAPEPAGTRARRLTQRTLQYVGALAATSLVAGLATAPFAAFHFQRLAPWSLLANLAALPLVSFIIMPAGLAGAVLLPFGWDAPAWHVMGWGIDRMMDVSNWIGGLPGADRSVRAFPQVALTLASLSLVGLCLLRSRLRPLALVPGVAALFIAVSAPRPEVLVDADGRSMAVRRTDGRLAVFGDGAGGAAASRFAAEQWLAADGDRSRIGSPDLAAGVRCDAQGCAVRRADGSFAVLARRRDFLTDDCRLAAILATRFAPPRGCAARVLAVGEGEAWLEADARADAARAPGGAEAAAEPGATFVPAGIDEDGAAGPDATSFDRADDGMPLPNLPAVAVTPDADETRRVDRLADRLAGTGAAALMPGPDGTLFLVRARPRGLDRPWLPRGGAQ